MTQYGFVINTKRCIGCRTCVVACKMEHDVALGAFRSKVLNSKGTMDYDAYEGTWPNVTLTFRLAQCQQCSEPACVEACPTGASKKQENGIVTVDKDACIGCKSCMSACPYDARTLDEEAMKIEKCDLCASRLGEGQLPMCEHSCPARAITSGDIDDASSAIAKLIAEKDVFQLYVEGGTGPNVYYL